MISNKSKIFDHVNGEFVLYLELAEGMDGMELHS